VKVDSKLQEAGYTARTDHLRRMVERGRTKKSQSRGASWLVVVESCGRWLYWASLVFQLLWHFYKVDFLVREIIQDEHNGRLLAAYFTWTRRFLDALPSTEKLVQYSFRTSVLSLWWNPMVPQVIRGFSQHILGLRSWYLCQIFSVFLRYFLFGFSQWQADHQDEIHAQLGIHSVMAFVSCYVSHHSYLSGPGSNCLLTFNLTLDLLSCYENYCDGHNAIVRYSEAAAITDAAGCATRTNRPNSETSPYDDDGKCAR
jgi:hypothetical protein